MRFNPELYFMEATMRRISILLLTLFTFLASAAWSQAQPQWKHKIITYNVPGAGNGAGQGTLAFGINSSGEVAGFYTDANSVNHGFLRKPNGTFKKFDPAGSTNTFVIGINNEGAIPGWYYDANNMMHGFLRARDGAITTFDAPGAGTGANQGTIAGDVNDLGAIAGYYIDTNNVSHGFVLNPDGNFTTLDAAGAGTAAGQGTFPMFFSCLTDFGASTGYYVDANNASHGFVLNPDGSITTFDAPLAGTGAGQGTYGESINRGGASTGYYVDENNVDHGFLLSPEGSIITINVRRAGTGAGQGTVAEGNNAEGAIVGQYYDANSVMHGFLRATDGKIPSSMPRARARVPARALSP